jgi:L-amino acid N-acyltransferase YncA
MTGVVVSDTRSPQLPEIAAIYAAAVADGPATFDLDAPPLAWWSSVLDSVDPRAGHLMLSALDEDEHVLGYAKSGGFRPKAAYDSTCETSIYVAADARGRGVGDALYRELFARLDRSGLRLAVAGMTAPNPASARLHLRHGFVEVGTFAGVGVKFGQPWDVVWYQRPLLAAALLDDLRTAVTAGPAAAVALLLERGGHEAVAVYGTDDGGLKQLATAGDQAALALPDLATLANGRGSRDGTQALFPVLAPGHGPTLGVLAVDARAEIDDLELGRLERCARALRPLWLDPPGKS